MSALRVCLSIRSLSLWYLSRYYCCYHTSTPVYGSRHIKRDPSRHSVSDDPEYINYLQFIQPPDEQKQPEEEAVVLSPAAEEPQPQQHHLPEQVSSFSSPPFPSSRSPVTSGSGSAYRAQLFAVRSARDKQEEEQTDIVDSGDSQKVRRWNRNMKSRRARANRRFAKQSSSYGRTRSINLNAFKPVPTTLSSQETQRMRMKLKDRQAAHEKELQAEFDKEVEQMRWQRPAPKTLSPEKQPAKKQSR